MKKTYSKPDIMFDSFSLCQSVANTCEIRANYQEGGCGVALTESISLFTSEVGSCSWKFEDQQYDGLCYHVPFDAYNVFAS